MDRPNLLFVTRSCFWKEGAGLWARTRAMVAFLADSFAVEVLFLGDIGNADARAIAAFGKPLRVSALPLPTRASREQVLGAVRTWLDAQPVPPRRLFIDKTELAFLHVLFQSSAFKVLDTHDIISLRNQSSRRVRGSCNDALGEQQEIALMNAFDIVLCIQADEAAWVKDRIGASRVLLAMHPVPATPVELRAEVRRIGMLASGWHANLDGLRWFVQDVWPMVRGGGLELVIFGGLCQRFETAQTDIHKRGPVKSIGDAYRELDVAINPVRYGAGLKIKTVEAMAHGLPVVATSEGASGLRSLDGDALLVADRPEAFASVIVRLSRDAALRQRLGQRGVDYVVRHLNPERCLGGVRDVLLNSTSGPLDR